MTLFSNSLRFNSNVENLNDTNIDIFDLRASGPQINITTPENKTYYGSMSGYYPATYGFENDATGATPFGWTTFHDSSCSSLVISELGGHKNILSINDNNGGGDADLYQTFPARQNGTVEFWTRKESGDTTSGIIQLTNSTGVYYCNVYIGYDYNNNGIFRYYNSSSQLTEFASGQYSDNIWMHIRIDFECGTGGYKGLSPDTFDLYLNGNKVISGERFWYDTDKITNLRLVTANARTGSFYIDAIGYSWDPNYNIGDNLNEGLLLSYENSTSLDWKGYSIDHQANKTILGNRAIPLPTEGTHSIQVFGNNSIGTNFQSEIRYFSVKYIKMITPENKTYTEPMSGYYPAVYGFECDEDYSAPDEWDDISMGSCSAYVVSEHDGHKKVVKFHDTVSSSGNDAGIGQKFTDGSKTSGTIEFWFYKDSGNAPLYFALKDTSDTTGINFRIDHDNNGKFQAGAGGWHDFPISGGYSDDKWIHNKIVFDCGTDTFDYYVDGVKKYDDGAFTNVVSNINEILLRTAYSWHQAIIYVDSIGYSWDLNYDIGDNMNEGLLLSFTTSTSLNWTGYSLDSQVNKTISGNTTISLPNEGFHNIQVFGNNSLGEMFESDIRYFSINTPPTITINTPNQNDLFGLNAPNFNVSIIDSNLNETWYTLDNGATNTTFIGFTGTINQTEWDKQISGPVTIRFYASDTFGTETFNDIIVLKDTLAPIITINLPDIDEFYAETPPSFDIIIDELSLDTTWYTLDNGVNNITFTGLTGIIDQTEWDNHNEGIVTLRFYANDTFGFINFTEIIINKDITDPVLIINSPSTGVSFTTIPPEYNISVDDINIESIWYSIDGSLTNYEITQFTGYIDSNAWNAAPAGAITIRFYVEDKAGNLVYEDIIVQKIIPPPPLDINLIIILIALVSFIGIGIIVGLFYRKKHVRIKKLRPIVIKGEKSVKSKRTKKTKIEKKKSIVIQPILNCPFCQAILIGDQEYCSYCGAKLVE